MKNRKVLLIAAGLGLFAVILTFGLISKLEDKYRGGAHMTEVLVARGYIAEGTLLKDFMVDAVKVPAAYKMPKAVESVSQLVNEEGLNIYATAVPIEAGEQILATKLLTPGKDTGLAIVVPQGKRAVSIPVDIASGVAELIKPGNYVDILCTLDVKEKTVTVLQNVLVLAWKQNILGTSPSHGKAKVGLGETPSTEDDVLPVVTVAVSPDGAQIIALASEKGVLRLTLRGLNDHKIESIDATTMNVFSK